MLSIAERRQIPASFQVDDRQLLRDIVAAIRTSAGKACEAIILFGSRARRDHHTDSDWDILIILDDAADLTKHRHVLREKLFDLGFSRGTKIDPMVIRWSDANDNPGVVGNAIDEGIPLV